MGRVFLEFPNGEGRLYSCGRCLAPLTCKSDLISTRFHGSTGTAYLFRKVVNVSMSHTERRSMLTGVHYVRDVYCKKCTEKLGWFYEFAFEKTEEYKEGHTILERALIVESDVTKHRVI